MNKLFLALIAAGTGSAWLGCSDSTPSSLTTQQQGSDAESGDFGARTLVTLNVPNMF